MNNITYNIAGHTWVVEGDVEKETLRALPGFSIFETPTTVDLHEAPWRLTFRGDEASHRELTTFWNSCKVLYTFDLEPKTSHCSFGRTAAFYGFTIWDDNPAIPPIIMRVSPDGMVESTEASQPQLLKFALWMAFGLIGAPQGLLPVHSSTIIHNNKAVLFLGESGTGKSTHTALWTKHIQGSQLLNDDSPILATAATGEPVVWGSPWSGKTHCYHNECATIAAIVRLSQAPANRIRRLDTLSAFTALHPSCPPAFAHDSRYTDHVVEIISKTVDKIPFYHLECLPNEAAAVLCANTIYGC